MLPPVEARTAKFSTLVVHVTLPAVFFALVISLSNVGLSKVGVNLHILLRSSEVRRRRATFALLESTTFY